MLPRPHGVAYDDDGVVQKEEQRVVDPWRTLNVPSFKHQEEDDDATRGDAKA